MGRLLVVYAVSLSLCTGMLLGGCSPAANDFVVHRRLRSPDGKLDAIFAEYVGGGPAVGVDQQVYLVEAGSPIRMEDRIFSGDHISSLMITWHSPRTLQIAYDDSRSVAPGHRSALGGRPRPRARKAWQSNCSHRVRLCLNRLGPKCLVSPHIAPARRLLA